MWMEDTFFGDRIGCIGGGYRKVNDIINCLVFQFICDRDHD